MDHGINRVKLEILRNFPTQGDFAETLHVHESKVSQILRGRRKLSPEDVRKWGRVLGCKPSILKPVSKFEATETGKKRC